LASTRSAVRRKRELAQRDEVALFEEALDGARDAWWVT
jgi:glutamate-1-semialdehyde aminotransferase